MEPVKPNHNLTIGELAMLCGNIVVYMTRDLVQFTARGVLQADITALEAQGDAYEVFPSDEYYSAEITIAAEGKRTYRDESFRKIQYISGFFEQKWGLNSGRYKQLGIKGLVRMRDNDFIMTGRGVVKVATEQLANLTALGLLEADIDALETSLQNMEDSIHLIAEKTALRDEKTQERVELGNALFSEIRKYATIGKLIWENVDESKYNDYIIYKTEHTGLSKPQNLLATYDPLNPPNITLSWDLVAEATSYDVYYNIANIGSPAGDFSLINNFAASPAEIPAIIDKRHYFKIKAKNDEDTSDYSDEVYVDVPVVE